MRRIHVVAITLLASLVFALALSGSQWILTLDLLVRLALPALLWIAACCGWGWLVLRSVSPRENEGVLMHVTAFALGSGVIALLQMLIAWAGMISMTSSLAICVPATLCLWPLRDAAKRAAISAYWNDRCGATALLIAIAIPLGISLVAACTLPGVLWGDEPHGYDVLTYHLLLPRQWHEAGRMMPMPGNAFSFFPFNIEMHFLWAMSVSRSSGMYLAQLLHLLLMFATPLAVYGIVRPRGRAVAAAASAMCAMTPWIALLGGVAYDEAALLLYGTLAFAWIIWAQELREVLIAGLLAGLACGGKYTAVPMVLVPCLLIAVYRSATHALQARHAVALPLVAALVVSPWLVRNVVWTGNPIFPLAANVLGHGAFSPQQIERWNVAHSPPPPQQSLSGRLDAMDQQIIRDWKFGGVSYGGVGVSVVSVTLLASLICVSVKRRESTLLWLTIAGVVCVVWITATHLQGRFAVLLVPIAAIALGQTTRWPAPLVGAIMCVPILFAGVLPRLQPAAIGVDAAMLEASGLTPQKQAEAILPPGGSIVLVGDSKPLWYTLPMSRVRYTSVFNLPADARDLVTAYLGDAEDDDVAIVNPSELDRLYRTYRNLPPPPAAIAAQSDVFVISVGELRRRVW